MRTIDRGKLSVALFTAAGAAAGAVLVEMLLRRQYTDVESMSGKTVVITGGSRGLGLLMGGEFARAGARVVLAARDADELERAKQMLLDKGALTSEADVLLVPCDLKVPSECQKLIERATAHFGRVDVLINNASTIHVGPIEQQPLEAYRDAMDIDYFAMVQTIQTVLPQMLDRKHGSIVNICSIGGKIPVPHLAPYVGSKFAAVGFSETLNAEMRSKGIRVTTVCPGLMRTGSFPNAIVVGQREKEYRWFSLAAATPGVAQSAVRAARKIFVATCEGRGEVAVGWDAFLAARLYGLAPDSVQYLAQLANTFILPNPTGSTQPVPGRTLNTRK